jgi:hypothetical protein
VLATGVVNDAEVALARAHASEGEKYALYETTLADLYLAKAKEEQSHAHYRIAQQLAADSLRIAQVATRKAAERRGGDNATPASTATVQHPAEPTRPAPSVPIVTPRSPTTPPAPSPTTPSTTTTPTTPTTTTTTTPTTTPAKPKPPNDPGHLP